MKFRNAIACILILFFLGLPLQAQMVTALSPATGCYVKSGTGTVADTTNHASCSAVPTQMYTIRAVNTSATLAYLRLYNLATDPTCSSATGYVESIPIPASTAGAGLADPSAVPIAYTTGLGYCVTGGSGSTDNTAPPAGVFITIKHRAL
jgi:hypothetical protein